MKFATLIPVAALICISTEASAQDTAPLPPPPMQEVPVPPGPQAPEMPEAATTYSDTEVQAFATAALRLRALGSDENLDDAARQAAAEAIIMEEGLDMQTFSAMQSAAQTDPALASRIQMAIEATVADQESR